MNVSEKISALRQAMREQNLNAWLAFTSDPHLSEYLPEHWQTRQYLSGFTGSAGTLVVTETEAALWTDSRYWEQAEKQLSGSEIQLRKLGVDINFPDFLVQKLPENSRVGAAADCVSLSQQIQFNQIFNKKNIVLDLTTDIVDKIWIDRPALPRAPIFVHRAECVLETAAQKLARVRAAMRDKGADFHLISALDDIAWLTNLRGNDVPYNPVFLAYLLIGADTAVLYADAHQLTAEAQNQLQTAQIQVAEYTQIWADMGEIRGNLLIDKNKTAVGTLLFRQPESGFLIDEINPSSLFKSIKSDADIAHIRETMRQDGVALCEFFAEFERRLAAQERLTELDVDTILYKYRSARPNFVSLSFNTIAGFNENGALPHYCATAEAHSEIVGQGLLLIDSGAQYWGGTTDITRVIAIGEPTAEQKRDYTLVLKAHIALAQAVFPENIGSTLLDAICRQPLWQAQCNYGHGTGHGVGYFLNVHEGPQAISYASKSNPNQAMKAGMITSNEPGLYRPKKWGVRIENLVANLPVENPQETEFGKFLYFETLTLCPIDTRPINLEMLTTEEVNWLNDYHANVREQLLPLVDGEAKDWLVKNTEFI